MAELIQGRIVETDAPAGLKLMQMGFGRKLEQGVVLEWLEAAYLTERKLLEVKDGGKIMSAEELIAEPKKKEEKNITKKKKKTGQVAVASSVDSASRTSSASFPLAPSRADQYAIYRRLRGGGRVVRFSSGSPLQWRVYDKGVGREQDRPMMLLSIVPPGWNVTIDSLEKQLAVARLLRVDLGMAFVRDGRPVMMKVSKPPVE